MFATGMQQGVRVAHGAHLGLNRNDVRRHRSDELESESVGRRGTSLWNRVALGRGRVPRRNKRWEEELDGVTIDLEVSHVPEW